MMRALIGKELRENVAVAALAAAVLGGVMAVALYVSGRPPISGEAPFPLLSYLFQAITIDGAPLIGLFLGLRLLREGRGDRWAFLVHRPLSRTAIFHAKVVAALTLYLAATGLPFLLASAWVAYPANVPAPFYASMMIPGLMDILVGVTYLLAGMLIAWRQGRWLGSRVFAAGAAVAASAASLLIPQFWGAALVAVAVAGVLFIGARGAFITAGVCSPQPRHVRMALGATLALGFLGAGMLLLAALAPLLTVYQNPPSNSFYYSNYSVDSKGHFVITRSGPHFQMVVDAEGKPATPGDTLLLASISSPEDRSGEGSPEHYRSSMPASLVDRLGQPNWFYSRAERCLMQYAPYGPLMGTLGPDGFRLADQGRAAPFPPQTVDVPINWNYPLVMFAPSAVFTVDLGFHRVNRVFTAPPDETLVSVGATNPLTSQATMIPMLIAARSRTKLHIITADGSAMGNAGREVLTLPIESDMQDHCDIEVGHVADTDQYVVLYQSYGPVLVRYDKAGHVIQRQELPPDQSPSEPPDNAPFRLMATGNPLGLVLARAAVNWMHARRLWNDFNPFDDPWVTILSVASAVLCTILNVLRARRYAFSQGQLLTWGSVGLLLGPAGVLTMLSMLDRPAKVTCTSCGQPRTVFHQRCESCGEPHAPPHRDGTEIFA